MKISLRTKFLIIIFPLLIITIYLLSMAIIPHLEINKDLKYIKLHISSLLTGEKFARFFNLQVNEYAELVLTGTIKEEQEMDGTQNMFQSSLIEWRKELQKGKDNNERRINLGMLDNIEKRYNDVIKLRREFIELVNNGKTEQALEVFEEIEVLLEGFILIRMERLISGEEEKVKEYLMHVYNHAQHMTFFTFQGLSSVIGDIQQDIEQVVLAERFARLFIRQVREYAGFILIGKTVECKVNESRETALITLDDWKEEIKKEFEEDEREEELYDFAKIEKEYFSVSESGQEVIELIKEGRKEQAIRIFIEEIKPSLGNVILAMIDKFVQEGHAEIRKDLSSLAGSVALLNFILGFSIFIIIVIGIGVPWLLSRKIVDPILKLKEVITRVGTGEFKTRVEIPAGDELGELAESFNKMTENLGKAVAVKEEEITERKKAEEMVRESESRYKVLFESSTEGILIVDLGTKKFLFVNPAICKMLGYTEEELTGKNIAYIHPKESLDYIVTNFEAMINGKVSSIRDIPFLKKDGSIIMADAAGFKTIINGSMCGIGLFRDITERREAERKLEESERRYRAVIEASGDGVLIADSETKQFMYANPALCKLLGYIEDELRSMGVADIHRKDDMPHVMAEFEALARGEKRLASDIPCLRKDGTIVFVDINTAVTVIDGRQCNVGFFRDITERKKAEEELAKTKDRLSYLQKSTSAILYTCMTTGDYAATYITENVYAQLGYTQEEFLSGPDFWASHIHPDDRERVFIEMQDILKKGHLNYEYRFLHKNGTYIWLSDESNVMYDAAGNPVEIVGYIINISESKKEEENLDQVNKCLINFGPDPDENIKKICNTTGLILDGATTLYNKERGDFLCTMDGWNIPDDLKTEDDKKGHICFDIIQKNEEEPVVIENLDKTQYADTDINVRKYNLKTYIGCAVKVSGKAVGSLCVVYQQQRKFTHSELKILSILARALGVEEERKNAEKEKEILQSQLIQSDKMASLGEMGAGIAHELNTPLNVILGYQELMQRKIEKHPEFKEFVDISIEEVEFCRDLIQDFLIYAQPSQGKISPLDSVDIAEIVHGIIRLVPQHKERGINIKLETKENLPLIKGNQKQLTQVFVNLVNNAIYAMPEGGDLVISTRLVKHDQKEGNGETVEFLIHDTGEGISKENITRVFDPFFTSKRPGKGTGLGLAVCQRIIENHKGTIRIESEPGKGTTVIGQLPV